MKDWSCHRRGTGGTGNLLACVLLLLLFILGVVSSFAFRSSTGSVGGCGSVVSQGPLRSLRLEYSLGSGSATRKLLGVAPCGLTTTTCRKGTALIPGGGDSSAPLLCAVLGVLWPRNGRGASTTRCRAHSAANANANANAKGLRPRPTIGRSDGRRARSREHHEVDGVRCVEVPIDLPIVGRVTVLEATAASQEVLVDMALTLEDENDSADGNAKTQRQRLKAGDPYGAVLWPSASAVASYLLLNVTNDGKGSASAAGHPSADAPSAKVVGHQHEVRRRSYGEREPLPLRGLTILELGAGTGLVSIASALGGATGVVATDYEDVPLSLLRYAAQNLCHSGGGNDDGAAKMQGRGVAHIQTELFDICDLDTPLPDADIVVAADILYDPRTGVAAARRAYEAVARGSRFVLGDSPGRPGRPSFLAELRELLRRGGDADGDADGYADGDDVEVDFFDAVGWTCSGERHDLICGEGSLSVSETPRPLQVAILDLCSGVAV